MLDRPAVHLSRPPRHGITSLGFGRRTVIWLQGCDLACPGCTSLDTHAPGGDAWLADELAEVIAAAGGDGLTVSGGEPFQQPEGLEALLGAVRQRTDPRAYDIFCFSGHRIEHLQRGQQGAIDHLDALVDGRFRQDLPTNLPLRGSSNQRLHRLTLLGIDRYRWADDPAQRPALQLVFDGDGAELIGVPDPGQMDAIEHRLSEVGIELGGASWRS